MSIYYNSFMHKLLSIVIITWNNKEDIETCLSSVIDSCKLLKNFSITVVDNLSSDNTIEIIEKKFPSVRILKQNENLGYAKGVNVGIKAEEADHYLILNPDTEINKKAIDIMLEIQQSQNDVGVVAVEQWDQNNKVRYTVSHANLPLFTLLTLEKIYKHLTFSKKHKVLFDHTYTVNMLNGGCFLVKKEAFDEVGLLCNELFMYGEEEEFFGRVRKAGWKIEFLREAIIYHFREKSIKKSGKKWRYYIDSRIRLFKHKIKSF